MNIDRESVTRTLIAGGIGVGLLHADTTSRSRLRPCHGAFLLALLGATRAYAEPDGEPSSRMSAESGLGYSLLQLGSNWDYARNGVVARAAISANTLSARRAHRMFIGIATEVARANAFVDGVVVQATFVAFVRPELRLTSRLPLFAYGVVGVGVSFGHQFIADKDNDCDCDLTNTAAVVRAAVGAKVVLGPRWALWLEPFSWDVALGPADINGVLHYHRYALMSGAAIQF
jgi:hypothetical protein